MQFDPGTEYTPQWLEAGNSHNSARAEQQQNGVEQPAGQGGKHSDIY